MNRPLVTLARQILCVAVFAFGLRRDGGATRASYRRTVYGWAADTIASLLRRCHPDPEVDVAPAQPMLHAIGATVERMKAEQGSANPSDWYPQHTEALIRDARALLWTALGTDRTQRLLWWIDCVPVMSRRMTLTLVAGLVGVGLVFGSPTVRGVVFQSRAGLLSLNGAPGDALHGRLADLSARAGQLLEPALAPTGAQARRMAPGACRTGGSWAPWGLIGLASVLVIRGFLLVAPRQASFRTPFVTTATLVGMLTLCHGFDIGDYLDPRPVRFVAAAVAAIALCASLGYSPEAPWTASAAVASDAVPTRPGPAAVATWPWVGADRWPPPGDGHVVVVAPSGRGFRAAMFAASALLAMRDETPTVESSIQSVSGVSGGSLAIVGYVALRLGRVTPKRYREAMEADYVWPLLQAIVTFHDRADAVQTDWNKRLHLWGASRSRGVDQCRTEAAWRGASQARKSDETALPVP